MTKTLVQAFNQDVAEYLDKEREVSRNFLEGIIELGEILSRQRDKWKEQDKWLEYIGKIGKTVVWANQMIRTYEYALQHKRDLVKANLTNWSKVNLFLALPDDQRTKVADAVDSKEVSTDEFRQTVEDIKEDDIEVPGLSPESELVAATDEALKMIQEASLSRPDFASKELIKLLKKDFPFLTKFSENIAVAFLMLENAKKNIQETKNLTGEEKAFWSAQIAEKLTQVQQASIIIKS